MPLVPGEATGPGLVAYLAPAEVRPRLLARTAAALLRETEGRVVLAASGVTAEEVLGALAGPGGATLEGLRREGRRLERLLRRLEVPRGGPLPVERFLRAAAGASAVVVDAAARLEMGSPEPARWLGDLHSGASHFGFPVFLVADPSFVPASAAVRRTRVFETLP